MFEVKDSVHRSRRWQTAVIILILKTACSTGKRKKHLLTSFASHGGKKKIVPCYLIGYIYLRKEENIPYA